MSQRQQQSNRQPLIPFPAQIDQYAQESYKARIATITEQCGGQIPPDNMEAARRNAADFASKAAEALREAITKEKKENQREAAVPTLHHVESASSSVLPAPTSILYSSPVTTLGPKTGSKRMSYYQGDEQLWIAKEGKAKGSSTWAQLAERFNEEFEPKGRSARTGNQIRLQYHGLLQKELKPQLAAQGMDEDVDVNRRGKTNMGQPHANHLRPWEL